MKYLDSASIASMPERVDFSNNALVFDLRHGVLISDQFANARTVAWLFDSHGNARLAWHPADLDPNRHRGPGGCARRNP